MIFNIIMFKKNPNRPPIIVELKKIPNGYKVQSNDIYNLFLTKRVTRTMYRRSQLLIQPILFKVQTLDYSHKDSPFLAPSFAIENYVSTTVFYCACNRFLRNI